MDHSIIRSRLPHAEQSSAFHRWAIRSAEDMEPPASGPDLFLTEYLEEIGFAGLPHVVSCIELDKYIVGGEVELVQPEPEPLRGVSKSEYAEQFRRGKLYVGSGAFGNGVYTAFGERAVVLARRSAGPTGTILRMSLKAEARVATLRDTEAEMMAEREQRREMGNLPFPTELLLYTDAGRYAAHRDYDAVRVEAHESLMLVLNRTALRVQEEPYDPA